MKYFLHDSSSFEDEKISLLFIEYGYEGLGLFYTILEKLAKQEKPINTKVLKMQLKVGKKLEKCWSFMEEIEIISSKNGETFNKRLTKFNESMNKTRERKSKWISEYRDNQEDTKYVEVYNESTGRSNLTKHNNTKDIDTKVSMDTPKISLEEKAVKHKFREPSQEEVQAYFKEKNNCSDQAAQAFTNKFWSHYENNGWKVGKNKMKDWHLAITSTWSETAEEIIRKYPLLNGSQAPKINNNSFV